MGGGTRASHAQRKRTKWSTSGAHTRAATGVRKGTRAAATRTPERPRSGVAWPTRSASADAAASDAYSARTRGALLYEPLTPPASSLPLANRRV